MDAVKLLLVIHYDQNSCEHTVCCDADGHCLYMFTVVHIALFIYV